uniref:zinc-ribbon domain-containing protein n=1 Tax=Pararhizobium sp. IMCC3301 TaxID=3067904 RepID=UPI002741790B|nr:zinc-ribbon domain-containing protein [Pararhizobium sp. IMCC3301]
MKIACPRCDTRYALSEEALGDQGRKMKCAKCAAVWLALPETPALTARQSLQALRPSQQAAVQPRTQIDIDPATPPHSIGPSDAERWEEDLAQERSAQNSRSAEVPEKPAAKAQSHQIADKQKRKSGLRRTSAKAFGSIVASWQMISRLGTWMTHLRFREKLIVLSALAIPVYMLAGLYAGREFVVRQVPDLAGLYRLIGVEVNLYGLAFEDVRTVRRPENGVAVLIVEGAVRNISQQSKDVPRLHFILSGREREVYSWQDEATPAPLEPGSTVRFRTVLAAPPDVADELHVRFFNSDPRLNRL